MSKVNYATLIKDAISTLKERGGSSLQAIKKIGIEKWPYRQLLKQRRVSAFPPTRRRAAVASCCSMQSCLPACLAWVHFCCPACSAWSGC